MDSLDDMRIDKAERPKETLTSISNFKKHRDRKKRAPTTTYLSSSVLRSALRLGEFSLSAFPAITQTIVAAAVAASTHHSSWTATDSWVNIVIVGTCAAGVVNFVVAMRSMGSMRLNVYNGRELGS